ncbi:hypothetical protein [Neptuniibacter sp. QD34_54]|uniref:hypothetical protein n=1 Tax=Neptuniibacter sp. QD34_54 TaxID=3398208 RepID=UPI0039F61E54
MDIEIADRIEMRCSRMLERSTKGLPELLKEKNWRGVPGVAHGKCRDSLVLGMLKARKGEDLEAVFDIFCEGAEAAEYLLKVPPCELPISRLDIPLFLCLITGRFDLAHKLASLVLSEELVFIRSSHFDLHTKMIAGFILENLSVIEENEKALFKLTKIYRWEKQRLYFEMYKNIVTGDAEALNINIGKAQESFASRKDDKKFGDQLGEYGGMEYNQFALDFMGLGIASLAVHKGFNVHCDTEYLPQQLVVYANARA